MMAKSLEDTAFYRYHALLGLNEVGGDPDAAGAVDRRTSTRGWRSARGHFTHGLTATATHDTKRGEDARTRILALSDMPDALGRARGALARDECAASSIDATTGAARPPATNT